MLRVGRSLVSALTRSGVQVAVLDSTKVANDAVGRHNILSKLHATALVDTLNSAILLNMNMKGEERVELSIFSQDPASPVQAVRAESIFTGEVRGYVNPTHSDTVGQYDGPNHGLGADPILHVSKVLYSQEQKQQSYIQIPDESIEQGLETYFEKSDQIDSFVRLSATATAVANGEQTCPHFDRSGGLFAQRLPGVPDVDWAGVVGSLREQSTLYKDIVHVASDPASEFYGDLIGSLCAHVPSIDIDETTVRRKPIDFFCRCTREKFLSQILGMTLETRKDLLQDSDPVITRCHNCNTSYSFGESDILGEAA